MRHRWVSLATAALIAVACSDDSESAVESPTTVPADAVAATSVPTTTADSSQERRTSAPPSDYSEVGPAYAAAYDATLEAGREFVDALLAGDTEAAFARLSDELKERISEDDLRAGYEDLTVDRVRFEDPAVIAVFDGRLSDDTISGTVTQSGQIVVPFFLERSSAGEQGAPLLGQWQGAITAPTQEIGIAVAFDTAGEELSGTIDVAEQGLSNPLEHVRYEPSVEIGERLAEDVFVQSPDARLYASEHAWGPWTLKVGMVIDAAGTIVDLDDPHGLVTLPPDPAANYTTGTEFRLPADGVWLAAAAGPSEVQNHHVLAPNQRHAYDLVVWNEGGTHQGDGSRNEDYWAWEQPILSPVDGTVVTVVDGIEDNPSPPSVQATAAQVAGNHIVLETGPGEYLFIAHFRQASIEVDEGDEVTAGAMLGLTGNSGNSSEPHIHIHLQDEADFFSPTAKGLPLPFTGYLADNEAVSIDVLQQGQLVQDVQE